MKRITRRPQRLLAVFIAAYAALGIALAYRDFGWPVLAVGIPVAVYAAWDVWTAEPVPHDDALQEAGRDR